MAGQLSGGIRSVWAGEGRPHEKTSACKRSCCWTPGFGHSTVRDSFPAWHKDACHCHDDEKGQAS